MLLLNFVATVIFVRVFDTVGTDMLLGRCGLCCSHLAFDNARKLLASRVACVSFFEQEGRCSAASISERIIGTIERRTRNDVDQTLLFLESNGPERRVES